MATKPNPLRARRLAILIGLLGALCLPRFANRRANCPEKKSRASFDAPLSSDQVRSNYTQVITPAVVTPESQAFAERACEAVAVHAGGGPTTAVAVTVTSFDGLKPCAEPLPEKYAPLLSAAYCSSYVARLRRSDFIAATYALSFVLANFGIAIAARIPIMTTTIKSSISVKPFLLRSISSPEAGGLCEWLGHRYQ